MKFNGEDWKGVSVADLEGNIRAGAAYLSNKRLQCRYGILVVCVEAIISGLEDLQK